MKWEILKGSDKDFDGAPEWATLRTMTCGQRYFVEEHKASARLINIDTREKSTIDPHAVRDQFYAIEVIAERCPITEPVVNQQLTTEWDARGCRLQGLNVSMSYMLASGENAELNLSAEN